MFLLSLQKDDHGIEGQKASGTRRVYELVTFNLIMHTYGYVNEVETRGEGEGQSCQYSKDVKRKTKAKVKLITFPLPEIESYGNENECPEEKLEEKTRPADIANKKSEENGTAEEVKKIVTMLNEAEVLAEDVVAKGEESRRKSL
ncbi:hypothetical protein QYF36_013180 [Acer negundo]|nr:hypothetical protein QYF36_013180 [Acer negundo]